MLLLQTQDQYSFGSFISSIIDKNPGILNILISGVILPISILWITNRNNRKSKDLDKLLERKYILKDDIRSQEKIVYSSLSKILFDVQQLHVSLSGTCIDTNCIKDAMNKFDKSLEKCHSDISDNMLYLSSKAIDLIYDFYNNIGKLKIELQEIDKLQEHSVANVPVYYTAQRLADVLTEIQELFITQRSELLILFNKLGQQNMKYCCGRIPPKELQDKYEKVCNAMISQKLI